MTDTSVADVEAKLDRVADADDEEAMALLRRAREDIGRLRAHSAADEETIERLEAQLERHEEAFAHRDEYGGSFGAAMNPDEEDAA